MQSVIISKTKNQKQNIFYYLKSCMQASIRNEMIFILGNCTFCTIITMTYVFAFTIVIVDNVIKGG